MMGQKMQIWRQSAALGLIWALLPTGAGADQGAFTNGVPVATTVLGTELVPADKVGGSEALSVAQISGFAQQGQLDKQNWLIGGDANLNLWQRATTGASVTTTLTYGGPDRWAYWSGAGTAMKVLKAPGGALIGQFGFRMQRTAAETGTVPVCMEQVVESINASQLQGHTVELDFHATTGANFSPSGGNMTAYIVTGTVSDEGSAAMAKGLNGGGGGGSGWSGQANATAAVISLGGPSTNGRYAAFANIPGSAEEVGVALCFVPVGTAGTFDFINFGNVQLVKNDAQTALISPTAGYSCSAIACSAVVGREALVDAVLQWRYYWEQDETTGPDVLGNCRSHSVTVMDCFVKWPVPMRVVPTMSYVAGFATETTAAGGMLGACSALATSSTVAAVASVAGIEVGCTTATAPAAGTAGLLWDNGGAGKIKASAEL